MRVALALPALLIALAGPGNPEFDAGLAALAVHDPTSAITHFEHVDTPQGQEWLAVALMMEARSASDRYVERAFDAAVRSRAGGAAQTRATIAAALRPSDLVIAFLIGEKYAFAW